MKKAFQITIATSLFTIEEDAYLVLQKYLTSIGNYFDTIDGEDEVKLDIEARIAEQLLSRIATHQSIVTLDDVGAVMKVMGSIEEIRGESMDEKSQEKMVENNSVVKRRLYRDADDVVIGGVCSGVAAYFDVDPVWIRLIAAVLLLTSGGTAVFIYVVMYIIVPPAKTPAEKIAMRGGPLTLSSFKETVEEKVELLRETKDTLVQKKGGLRDFLEKCFSMVGNGIRLLGRFIGKLIGLIMSVVGIGALAMLVFVATNAIVNVDSPYVEFPIADVVGLPLYYVLVGLGFVLAVVPLILVIALGSSLLKMRKTITPLAMISYMSVWVIAAVVAATIGIRYAPLIEQRVGELSVMQSVTEKKVVSQFHGIDMGGVGRVFVVTGDVYAVELVGNERALARVATRVVDGMLEVRKIAPRNFCIVCIDHGVDVRVTVPRLDTVVVRDAVRIEDMVLEGENISVVLHDVARMEGVVRGKNTEITVSDAARVTLSGESSQVSLMSEDVARVLVSELMGDVVTVTARDASRVEVFARDTLQVEARDVARIVYRGLPVITQKLFDVARVEAMVETESPQ